MGWVMSEVVSDCSGWDWARCLSSPAEWGGSASESCASDPWQERAEQAQCPTLLPWAALSCKSVGPGRTLAM